MSPNPVVFLLQSLGIILLVVVTVGYYLVSLPSPKPTHKEKHRAKTKAKIDKQKADLLNKRTKFIRAKEAKDKKSKVKVKKKTS